MAKPKQPRFIATVQIDNGKKVFAPGEPIEPSDLDPAVWAAQLATDRIVDQNIAAGEAGIAELRRLNDAGQAALDELKASAAE